MIIKRIEGCTRVLGQEQGFLGLPLRDEERDCVIAGQTHRCRVMVTAWEPTPDELERIKVGATVYLTVMGIGHPPVSLDVGEVPA